MKYKIIAFAAFIVAITSPAIAQGTAVPTENQDSSSQVPVASAHATPGLRERNPRYIVRKGDTFDLDFALSPEFNQTVAVQPDGYVTLKGVGSIFVEGQTVPELTETVKAAYSKILHDPVIAIAPKDFEKPYFIALGQVSKPGKYDLRSDLTLTEAVAIAGGFNDKAKHSQVVLFHPAPGGGGYEAKLIDVKKLLATRNLSEDPQMRPGDMLYVPQSTFSKIRPFLPTTSMGAYLSPAMF
jgi:polysaccharide export outer membrane protein